MRRHPERTEQAEIVTRRPLSAEDAAALAQHFAKQPSKYRNVKTVVDGITFASRKEAKRYGELLILQKIGEIGDITVQPVFPLWAHTGMAQEPPEVVGDYVADFCYDKGTELIVEDVKGVKTPLYRWKKKHFEAQYKIRILET